MATVVRNAETTEGAQYPYSNQQPIEDVLEIWDESVAGIRFPSTYPVTYKPVMWQVTDRYPAGDFFPQSAGADVNVWMVDWRELLGKNLPVVKKDNDIKRAWRRLKYTLNRER